MLCIAAVSKPLVQMFNEERKIFLSIYVNFVTWSRPAAHINILTTDYVEAMLKWYLIFILWWVVLLPQIVLLNLNREAENQRFEKVRHLASECVVKIGCRPPSVHHYLMVTDCSEAALLRQISCADSIRNQDAPRVPQLSISQAPVSPRKDVWKCPPFNLAGFMGFDWCCQWGEIWLYDALWATMQTESSPTFNLDCQLITSP